MVFSGKRARAEKQQQRVEQQRKKVLSEFLTRISGGADCLSVTGALLGDAGIKSLIDALLEKQTMKWLQLEYNQIANDGASDLARLLAANTVLRVLDLDYNLIGDTGAGMLASALLTNSNLVDLHLHCNSIGVPGVVKIAEALETNSTLGTLSLHGNPVGDEGAERLAQALHKNETLRVLHLGSAEIGDDGAVHLAEAIQKNKRLWALHLVKNQISDPGAAYLAKAVLENPILGELWLQENHIGEFGASELLKCLRPPAKLRCLGVTVSRVSDVQCKELNTAFRKRHALQHAARNLSAGIMRLDLSGQKLGDDGVKELTDAIKYNKTLQELYLKKNGIGDLGVEDLVQAVLTCSDIYKICLACNQISDFGASKLVSILDAANANIDLLEQSTAEPPKIKELDLEWNGITDQGACVLADAIERNTCLEKFSLHGNPIGDVGMARLTAASESCPTLQKLAIARESTAEDVDGGDLSRNPSEHSEYLKWQDQSTRDDEHSSLPSFDDDVFEEGCDDAVRGESGVTETEETDDFNRINPSKPFSAAFSPEFQGEPEENWV